MRGGLGGIIGLGFDDASADPIDKQADTDQIACDIERASPEKIGLERGLAYRRSPAQRSFRRISDGQ
jgi:hypothetical protein